MGDQPKLGSHGKNRIFGPKIDIWGPKKRALLYSNHALASTGKFKLDKKVELN